MKNFLFIIASLLLISCQSFDFRRSSEHVDIVGEADGHGMIVLGDKLEDPYSVENVTKALNTLYASKADRVPIEATDYYVRFLPQDEYEYERLCSLGLTLLDHPVDYEILKEGDYYQDPEIGDDRITWQYTVVPVDFDFPEDIHYEVLDECFIHENKPTKADWVDWNAVEREAYRISGNEAMLSPASKANEGGEVPKGRIVIKDPDFSSEAIGVKGVKVSCNTFVKFDNAFTDDEGQYVMNRSFNSKLRYRLVFKNRNGFAIGFNLIVSPASSSSLGKHPASGVDYTIDSSSETKLFTRCAVNNAADDYYSKCKSDIGTMRTPPANLRIWLFQKMATSSAVMMQQGAMVDNSKIAEYLKEYSFILKLFLPDVTIGLSECRSYADIYGVTVHEMAHASHYMIVGNKYWDKYIEYIISSFISSGFVTYGSGTGDNAGYCEVGEMWAYYMQSKLYSERYTSNPRNFGLDYWFHPQIFLQLDEKGLDKYRIYGVLGTDIIDREILKKKMLSMYPQYKTAINQAFSRYN